MQVSVIIPLFNEAESLPELTEWIARVMKQNLHGGQAGNFSYEIILVDDGSKDNSWQVIETLSFQNPSIKGIKFRRNYGKSAALNEGFRAAEGEVVITMDADLQDSPDEIPALYSMIKNEGYDLVSGWKKKRYDPVSKTIPTKLFNWTTRRMSGIHLHDFNCGLKAYRKEVVKTVEVYGEMHRYIPVIAKWAGFTKIGEKIVEHRRRQYGVTKFGLERFVYGFLDLLSVAFTVRYLKRPMHFFGTIGIFSSAIGVLISLYLSFLKVFYNEPLSNRPLLLFAILLILLGVQLFIFGLLGEMISRNSPEKNLYLVEKKVGLLP